MDVGESQKINITTCSVHTLQCTVWVRQCQHDFLHFITLLVMFTVKNCVCVCVSSKQMLSLTTKHMSYSWKRVLLVHSSERERLNLWLSQLKERVQLLTESYCSTCLPNNYTNNYNTARHRVTELCTVVTTHTRLFSASISESATRSVILSF